MAQVSNITIQQQPERYFVSIRKNIHFFNEYADFLGKSIHTLLPMIEKNNTYPSSGLTVCFHNMELENLDVEVGYVVASQLEINGDVSLTKQPSRSIVLAIDRGPYEKQDPTLEALMQWINNHGYEMDGGIYYHYLNGEEQAVEEYLTQMYIPIVKSI